METPTHQPPAGVGKSNTVGHEATAASTAVGGVPAGVHRVLFVTQSTAVGGMETMMLDLAAEYTRRGITVAAVFPESPAFDALAERASRSCAYMLRLDTDARRGRRWQVARLRQLLHFIRQWRPDVVHLHTGGATGGLGVIAIARLARTPTVLITEHDVPAPDPGRWQRLTRTALDTLAHTTVAVSSRNAALRAGQLRRPARFARILNGVPVQAHDAHQRQQNRQAVREQHHIPTGAIVIGSVVRLAEGKGLDDLLLALSQMRAPATLLLVGDGPLHAALRASAAELGLADRVIFAGHQGDPGRFIDAMDVFVLPVPAGSMSIALLEAMAHGVAPVITFGGPEEAVIDGQTGLTAPPHDPPALARALDSIAKDAAMRARLASAAEAHVRQNFSVVRVASDYLALCEVTRRRVVPAQLRPRDFSSQSRPVTHDV